MARCFIVGASGAVGRFLLPRLLADGHDVVALSRHARASKTPRIEWLLGALDARFAMPARCDAIFSLGPLDVFADWFAAAGIGHASRVIAFGSTSIDSKRGSADADERRLAGRLRSAEDALARAADVRGCGWTIFRPTLIYGAGIDRSLTPLARFGARWRVFPRIAAARGLRQPVHADDLAAALMAAWRNPATSARTYALGGGERLPFAAMLERVRASLGVRTVPVPIPLAALRAVAAYGVARARVGAIERLLVDLVADDGAARGDFGWAPRRFEPDRTAWTRVLDVQSIEP